MSVEPGATPPALNPDLAGYPTAEALVAGYRNSSEEGKRQRERADKLETLLVEQLGSNSRQVIPDRRGTAEERLTTLGVPVDALEEYVNERVQRGVRQAFDPLVNGFSARGKMVAEHPEYVQFENDVAQFIATDPGLSKAYPKMFEADPVEAMTYAFLKFGDSRRRANPAPNGGSTPVDAQIPSNRAGEGRRVPDREAQRQELFAKARSGRREDIEAFAKFRLGGVISEDFLRQ